MINTTAYSDISTVNGILDVSGLGLWEIFIDCKTGVASMHCNKNMLQLLALEEHIPPEECYLWWYNRIDDSYKKYITETIEKIIGDRTTLEIEYPWHRPDSLTYVRCRGSVISVTDEKIHVTGYHQDISELYNAKIQLQQQVTNFELGCEIGNYAVFELQYSSGVNCANTVPIIANKNFSKMFDLPTILIGLDEWDLVGSYFQPEMQKKWQTLLDYNTWKIDAKLKSEFTCQINEGEIRWLSLTCKVTRDVNLKLRLIGYIKDITDQKARELALETAKENAESANIAKSMFLANMSHEIRTPMNAVLNFAKFMEETELTEIQSDYVYKIHSSGSLMLNILNDILDFSKIEANKLSLELRPYHTRKEYKVIYAMLEQWIKEKNITFTETLSEDIPAYLVGDALRVRQILINLLNNAIKFTPMDGKITLEMTKAQTVGEFVWIKFKLSDSGIGMTDEQLGRLFTAFTQADPSIARRFGGTGLGLTICHMLVGLMGGKISVESSVNIGTTFVVEIPFRCATKEEITEIEIEAQTPFKDYKFSGLSCLVAEDNIINQQVILALLSSLKVTTCIANNGQEALDIFAKRDDFDCIFMDIQMPIMDGYTATQKLRELGTDKSNNIPIFALTANAMRGDNTKSIASGMNTHLTKPLNKLEICQTLAEYFPQFIETK